MSEINKTLQLIMSVQKILLCFGKLITKTPFINVKETSLLKNSAMIISDRTVYLCSTTCFLIDLLSDYGNDFPSQVPVHELLLEKCYRNGVCALINLRRIL